MAWSLSGLKEMEAWATKLWKQLNNEIWWRDWISDDESNIVQRKTDLTTQKGGKIHFGLLPRLTGVGKTADATLEGAEEDMTIYGDSVSIQQYRHAVVWPGAYWVQKVPFDVKDSMNTALTIWGEEKLDGLFFSALAGAHTGTNRLTVGDTSPIHSLGATNELTLTTIRKLPFLAKAARIRPVNRRGRKYYVFLMHDQAAYRLQSAYSTSAQSWYDTMLRARDRDPDNPLFAGGLGMVAGGDRAVILQSHDNANLKGTTTASDVACLSYILGAQSLLYGVAVEPWLTEKKFDYGNKYGLATGFMCGVRKAKFNADEYGVYKVVHWAPALS